MKMVTSVMITANAKISFQMKKDELIVMIWKEFPVYQIFIFCKYNNYFVSLHSFSLDVTSSKFHWF